jgi:hypothetical protein
MERMQNNNIHALSWQLCAWDEDNQKKENATMQYSQFLDD